MDSTPLLDRQAPVLATRPSSRFRPWLLGAAIGILISTLARRHGWFESLNTLTLAFLPAYYLAILVHELGHLAAARIAGFQFRQFAVGPLVISKQAGGLRARLAPGRIFAGGLVQAALETSDGLRRRFRIFAAGGPAASALLFAVIPLLPWGPFAKCLLLANLIGAAASWLPYYVGGYATDAKSILLLSRPGAEGDLLAAMLYLVALDTQGVAPRDWDPAAVAWLRTPGESPLAATASVLLVSHALDRSNPLELAEATERALALSHLMSPNLRRVAFESAACVQGFYCQNGPLASAWLEDARKVKGAIPERDWDADALAAIAVAEGRQGDAREHLTRAIARLDRHPGISGSVSSSRARLARLCQAATQVKSSGKDPIYW